MSITTDPAREFADLCRRLRNHNNKTGAEVLAEWFEVAAWSTEFMLIMASVHQRITDLKEMIDESELDQDIKHEAFIRLEQVRLAFGFAGFANPWTHSVEHYLNDANLMTIRMASAYLRPKHGYTVPEGEELDELISLIDDLLNWLSEKELTERDFIRTAMIDGLTNFRFRVVRVGWFGWPDTFETLREVIAAYMALERGQPQEESPIYEAMLKKVGSALKSVFDKVKFVKDVQETGDWLLKCYGAVHAVAYVSPTVAGLLTHTP